MASRGSIEAGRAVFRLNADQDPFVRALRQAEARLRAFGSRVTGAARSVGLAGAALAAPFVAAALTFSKTGDAAAKAARRTGIAVETFTALGFAARQSGADAQTLENGVRRMARSLSDLDRGSSTAVDSFGALGLELTDFAGLDTEGQLLLIADRLAQVEDASAKSAIAQQIFGRSGTQLIPLLNGGAAGIRALTDEARALGIVLSAEDAAAAEELTDSFGRVQSTVVGLTQSIGAALAPVLTRTANLVAAIIGSVRRWIDENRGLVVAAAAAAAGVVALGGALLTIGLSVTLAGVAVGGLATAITAIGAVLGAVLSPLGLTIAAVTALGVGVLTSTGAASTAIDALKAAFQGLRDGIGNTVEAIVQTLLAGDFATAGELLADLFAVGLDLAKSKALGALADLSSRAIETAVDTGTGLRIAWADALAGVQSLIVGAGGVIAKIWEGITTDIAKVIGTIVAKFDPTITAEEIRADLDAELASRNREIDAETKAKRAEIGSGQADTIAQILRERDAILETADGFTDGLQGIADGLTTQATERLTELEARAAEILARQEQAATRTEEAAPDDFDPDTVAADSQARIFSTFRASEASQLAVRAVNERMAEKLTSIDRTLKEIRNKPSGAVFA